MAVASCGADGLTIKVRLRSPSGVIASRKQMKTSLPLIVLLLAVSALARQEYNAIVDEDATGVIHGIVLGKDEQPARDIGITIVKDTTGPGALPMWEHHARTNKAGEYTFEHLGIGKYVLFVYDKKAGYAVLPSGPGLNERPCCMVKVEITADRPESEALVYLPPKPGFLDLHVTNKENGTPVSPIQIELSWADDPRIALYKGSFANKPDVFMIPPDRDLFLYVSSPGFRDWPDNAGKKIHLSSGAKLNLDVPLTPLAQ